MPVFIQLKGWSGDDDTQARAQLIKVFKLKSGQAVTIMEWMAQGRKWKYGAAVSEEKGRQAGAFFKKLGFEIELLPVEKPVAAGSVAVQAVSPGTISNTITAKDFEMPGVVWVTDESPEEIETKDDKRLLEIKKTPVFLVIFFLIITFGLYGIFWFINRIDALNDLDSKSKLSPGLFQTLLVISGTLLVFRILDTFFDINFGIDFILFPVSLVVTILFIVQAFMVRRILLDHFDANFTGLKIISGGLTLFLGVIFLQYKINGIHEWYEKEGDGEIQLNTDGLAWTFAILVWFLAPVALISYSAKTAFEDFDVDGAMTESFASGFQLGRYFASCDYYWQENGDDQICTKEEAGKSTPKYSENPKVTVTGSGTRETFYAEAVYEGSDSVLTINSQGEIGVKGEDESFVVDFDNNSGS